MEPATNWFRRTALLLTALAAAGCRAGAAASPPPGTSDGGMDRKVAATGQIPPMGQAKLEPWLAAGTYKAWTCESQIYNPRADPATPNIIGSHGRHRICSNDILLGSDSGPYPVGAASVKELFDASDGPYGFAVGLKVAPGTGIETWYWYERIGRLATLQPVADGVGDRTCGSDCHTMAARDNVFIRATN